MFDSIKSKASKAKGGSRRKKTVELTRTTSFVQALVNEELRLSYAALADAAEALGEHTPSGLSAGQRGSGLVKHLPLSLQPHICRGNGGYAKGQTWDTEVPGNLKARAFVRPEAVQAYVQAFVAATSEANDEAIIDPSDADIDALDDAHDEALERETGALDRD